MQYAAHGVTVHTHHMQEKYTSHLLLMFKLKKANKFYF